MGVCGEKGWSVGDKVACVRGDFPTNNGCLVMIHFIECTRYLEYECVWELCQACNFLLIVPTHTHNHNLSGLASIKMYTYDDTHNGKHHILYLYTFSSYMVYSIR